jgi:hypothetical protein
VRTKLKSTMNNSELIKSLRWKELWEKALGDTENDNEEKIAIRILVLSLIWEDYEQVRSLLDENKFVILKPIVLFCITLGYLCIGDVAAYKALTRKQNVLPKWMFSWIMIEYYGRSKQVKKQIRLVEKIVKENKKDPEWLWAAVIHSLNYKGSKKHLIHNWLGKTKLSIKNIDRLYFDPESSVLLHIDFKGTNKNLNKYFKLNAATLSYEKGEVLSSIKLFDEISVDSIMSYRIIDRWLGLAVSVPQGQKNLYKRINYIAAKTPESLSIKGIIMSYALIKSWANSEYDISFQIASKYKSFLDSSETEDTKNALVFFRYIIVLCNFRQRNSGYYIENKISKNLYLVGESHTLSPSNINFPLNNVLYKGVNRLVMGVKMHHLANELKYHYSICILEQIKNIVALEEDVSIMFCIGEIDARVNEGIWTYSNKYNLNINNVINDTVKGYIDFLVFHLKECGSLNIILQGIPAPVITNERALAVGNVGMYIEMVKNLNNEIKMYALSNNFSFLDVYSATVGDNGQSNGVWHIDANHISPLFYLQSAQWLRLPCH